MLFYREKMMYKQLLLTKQESDLLLKIIDHYECSTTNDSINVHILKRHIMGIKPTLNCNKSKSMGMNPTNQIEINSKSNR